MNPAQRIAQVEGIGPITAMASVSDLGDPRHFKNGRHYAAYLGLVPKQHSSGGKQKLLGISKRGDTYLRTLLIHGSRAALTHAKETEPWIMALRQRRPLNVAVVAVANKMARTIWALLAHDRTYRKDFIKQPA